jgi:hypothetical protein
VVNMRIVANICLLAGVAVGARVSKPYLWQAVPFSKIAEEIMDADRAAQELEWKVSNSTAMKDSVQWFLSTAMKELTILKKETMNETFEGSLGWKNRACLNRTTADRPSWNQSLTFGQAVVQDKKLAPTTIDASMYELYTANADIKKLTMELGKCQAKCPSGVSLLGLAKAKITATAHRFLARAPAPGPAPGPAAPAPAAGPPPPPTPRQLMKDVATAIYNTSASIDAMNQALSKDQSAMNVMEKVSAVVMEKLLKAKKDMVGLEAALDNCLHEPSATHLGDHVQEAMAMDAELSQELVKIAAQETQDEVAKVTTLKAQLADCKKKCDFWHPSSF